MQHGNRQEAVGHLPFLPERVVPDCQLACLPVCLSDTLDRQVPTYPLRGNSCFTHVRPGLDRQSNGWKLGPSIRSFHSHAGGSSADFPEPNFTTARLGDRQVDWVNSAVIQAQVFRRIQSRPFGELRRGHFSDSPDPACPIARSAIQHPLWCGSGIAATARWRAIRILMSWSSPAIHSPVGVENECRYYVGQSLTASTPGGTHVQARA